MTLLARIALTVYDSKTKKFETRSEVKECVHEPIAY